VINRLPKPVLGRFSAELTDAEIAAADIILLDVHWHVSLAEAIALAPRLKRVNPRATLIAGGVSASLFHRQLLRDAPFDYVVRGDAELATAELVRRLCNGAGVEDAPNVAGRDFVSPQRSCVTREDLDAGDYRDISWFPSLERRVLRLHRRARGYTFPTYPNLVIYRGCPQDCECCVGAPATQRRVFARPWALRSPEAVAADLAAWSDDPRISYVSLWHDPLQFGEEYARRAFPRRYELEAMFDLVTLPAAAALARALEAFRGGQIFFGLDRRHSTSTDPVDADELIARIRQARAPGRFNVVLNYARRFVQSDARYRKTLEQVVAATRCGTARVDWWWGFCPMPDESGAGSEDDYQRCLTGARDYRVMNALYRAGVYAHLLAPRLTRAALRLVQRLDLFAPT
jgi:hypothetical protein